MKLKYGSEKANAFMGEVMKMMLLTALRSSCDRAKKLGTFGKYRWEATKQSPVMDLVKELDPELYEDIHQHSFKKIARSGIPNMTTITPTAGALWPLNRRTSVTARAP